MAWIYKHPKSGRWFLGWRVGKKLFNRTTGTADRKEAEKQLATCEIMVDTNRQGRLTEAVFRSLTGQSVQRVALKVAVDGGLAGSGRAATHSEHRQTSQRKGRGFGNHSHCKVKYQTAVGDTAQGSRTAG